MFATWLAAVGRDPSTWPAIGNHTHCLIASIFWGLSVGAVTFLALSVRADHRLRRGSPLWQIGKVLLIATVLAAVAKYLVGPYD